MEHNQDHLRFRRRAMPMAGAAPSKSRFGIVLTLVTAAVVVPAMIYGLTHSDKVGSAVKQIARHVSLPVKEMRVAIVATRSTPTPQPSATPTPAPAATPAKHESRQHPAVLTAHEQHLKRLQTLMAESARARKIASAGSSDAAGPGTGATSDTTAPTQTTTGANQATTASLTSTQATAAPTPATVALAQAPDADATPVYAPDVVVDARFTHAVQPDYPAIAKDQGMQGTAVVLATIGPDGKVISAHIDQSTGDSLLDSAALDAARASGFQPPIINGKPATETYRLVYNFSL